MSSRWILLSSFSRLEERDVQAALQRVQDEFAETQAELDTIAAEYASWDDTYAFAAGEEPQYPQSNFPDATYQNLHLNLVLILDTAGQIRHGSGYDLAAGQVTAVPAGVLAQIPDLEQQVNSSGGAAGLSGLLLLADGPLAIAAHPILTSQDQGPSRGALIVGRYLSPTVLDELARSAHVALAVYRADDPQRPADFDAGQPATDMVRPLTAGTVAGYDQVLDLFGQPALLIRVDLPRTVYQQGQLTLNYFLGWFGGLCLLAGAIIYGVLDRLETSRQARLVAEARYQSIFEHAPYGIFQSTPGGGLLHANPALARIFGYASPGVFTQAVTNAAEQLYVDPQERERFTELLQTQGTISDFETSHQRQDGARIWTSISARLVRDAAGQVLYYEGFLQDITERRQAEERLRESE
ncbi:MAG: PAS domain S-box protein, partial [Anaerolineales bacterium]|nr:PAS domain S-box protein [Anaerolineales bacterium]